MGISDWLLADAKFVVEQGKEAEQMVAELRDLEAKGIFVSGHSDSKRIHGLLHEATWGTREAIELLRERLAAAKKEQTQVN